MMKKLGFAVPNLGASHMNYSLIRQINLFMTERFDTDIVLFYETLDLPCLPPACSRMQIHEGYGFDGPIVATSLTTAEKLIRFPSPSQKLFYVWDLEWLRMPQKSFEQLHSIYANPELTLVARGQDHADVLTDVWNRPVAAVIEDFVLSDFEKLLFPTPNVPPPNAGIPPRGISAQGP